MAAIHRPEVCRHCALTVGAVVEMVMETFVVATAPVGVIDAGLNVHFDSDGRPEHIKRIDSVSPPELTTLIDVIPVPPGAVMVTVDCPELGVAKKPGVIVNVCDCVVLLGLKLASPL